ncbi:TadE/TadG family type IV pilus assembly protein [Nocardioides sp.]|uniref:TadE/TadG family type IV pilus assembly protein n=1 Tax=Nocardioides sp. TaxID=35761 RepID=UPI0035170B53
MGRHVRHAREDRGAAALEFALIAPILLLLVFGIISFGFMLSFRQNLSQAAAEGARAAAVQLSDTTRTSAATAAITSALDTAGLTCSGGNLLKGSKDVGDCTVSAAAACSTGSTERCVTVRLVYNYRANPLIPSVPLVDRTLPATLSYSSTVRVS